MTAKILCLIALSTLVFPSSQNQYLGSSYITNPPNIFSRNPPIAAGSIEFTFTAPAGATMVIDFLASDGTSVGSDTSEGGQTKTI